MALGSEMTPADMHRQIGRLVFDGLWGSEYFQSPMSFAGVIND